VYLKPEKPVEDESNEDSRHHTDKQYQHVFQVAAYKKSEDKEQYDRQRRPGKVPRYLLTDEAGIVNRQYHIMARRNPALHSLNHILHLLCNPDIIDVSSGAYHHRNCVEAVDAIVTAGPLIPELHCDKI